MSPSCLQEVVTEEEESLSAALSEVAVRDEGEEVSQERRLTKTQRQLVRFCQASIETPTGVPSDLARTLKHASTMDCNLQREL